MRRADTHSEVLSEHVSFAGKTVVDVGCGTGDMTRWLAAQGAEAIGIDTAGMVAKAEENPSVGSERYLVGAAQALPLHAESADAFLYVASFHHVPKEERRRALDECARVLRGAGSALFVEPVAQKGAYCEIVRLIEDEAQVQAEAYAALKSAEHAGLEMKAEAFYYLDRSFEDFVHLAELNIDEEVRRAEILREARAVTERMCREAGASFEDFRFRSVCRLNVLTRRPA